MALFCPPPVCPANPNKHFHSDFFFFGDQINWVPVFRTNFIWYQMACATNTLVWTVIFEVFLVHIASSTGGQDPSWLSSFSTSALLFSFPTSVDDSITFTVVYVVLQGLMRASHH